MSEKQRRWRRYFNGGEGENHAEMGEGHSGGRKLRLSEKSREGDWEKGLVDVE